MLTTEEMLLYTLCATAISAISIIMYVAFTYWIMRASQRVTHEQLRPYIVVQIESEDGWIDFTMKNIGSRPAENVKIVFEPPLTVLSDLVPEDGKCDFTPMLQQKFFAPQYSLKTALFETKWFVEDRTCAKEFTVTITYQSLHRSRFNIRKGKFKETYQIELSSYIHARKEMMFTDIHDFIVFSKMVQEKMANINISLEKLALLAERH